MDHNYHPTHLNIDKTCRAIFQSFFHRSFFSFSDSSFFGLVSVLLSLGILSLSLAIVVVVLILILTFVPFVIAVAMTPKWLS